MKTGSREHKHTDRLWCAEGTRGKDVIHPVALLLVWSTFYEGLSVCVWEVWVTQSLLPGFIRINKDVMIVLLWLCVTQTWQRSRENCFLWQIIVELQAAIRLSRLIFYNLPPPPHNNFDLSVISSLRFFFFFLVSCRRQKNCLVIRLWKHFNIWNPESVPASHLDVFSPPPFATSALFSALCSQPQARVHSFLTVNSLFFSHAGCNCDRGCSCNRLSMYTLFLYVSAGAALA